MLQNFAILKYLIQITTKMLYLIYDFEYLFIFK